MAERSAAGNLTGFSGVFAVTELNPEERAGIENILLEFSDEKDPAPEDLHNLLSITSEVKAITNQAILLHGERIKKAQSILKKYREGAFTAWLIATYNNRQTPYNFLQYYDFFATVPETLRPQLEHMPRQAVYTLASREGPLERKHEIIEKYNGATKSELLILIREFFPLHEEDKRKSNHAESTILTLKKLSGSFHNKKIRLNQEQKKEISSLLDHLYELISG